MPARRYKPTSAGRRNSSVLTRDSVTREEPEKKLLAKIHKTGGRNNKGRITTIGSISGVLASGISAAYAMSKHAMEAFTDSLAQEMAQYGVGVSIVEPGTYNSEISRTALARSTS